MELNASVVRQPVTDHPHDARKVEIGRRTLLQAAMGAPVVAAASTWAAGPAAAAPAAGRGTAPGPRFTLAVVPDTQYLLDGGGSDPEPLNATFRDVVRRHRDGEVAFMAHLGDVTENGTDAEMRMADAAFRIVDGQVPYSVLAGNHDIDSSSDDTRGPTPYSRTFAPDRYRRDPTYGGSSANGYNSFHTFDGGGRTWLVLALDWRVSDAGLAWAQQVITAHPTLPVILTVHDLVAPVGVGGAELSEHGQRVWDRLIRPNDQIFLALCGHYWPPGRVVLKNDAGHDVHLHITNYQDRYYGGAAMMRLYAFDLARGAIDIETFSPWLLARRDRTPLEAELVELTSDVDRFTVEMDFEQRLAGFAPPALPAALPPAAVLVRDTVAYWRFDGAGFTGARSDRAPVGLDAVVRDLSGTGNDLRPERLHGGPPEVLTWSAEYDRYQPGHASLRFDGGQGPDRGAVLRTAATAPLTSATFDAGYTIETFLKLPDPFVGDHGFMGVLGWEGRNGKTGGYSPDDPPCSLNVSGEYFLQYVVYPTDRTDDPTSWTHAIAPGRWTHVAIVNDRKQTIIYVDGSRIARNATGPARGITTRGKPFAIGGAQSAEQYGQGFYGWIGDTRIVARALRPAEFLTAR